MKLPERLSPSKWDRFDSHSVSRRRFLIQAGLAATITGWPGKTFARKLETTSTDGFQIFAPDWTLDRPCDPSVFEFAAKIGLDGVQVDFGRPSQPGDSLPLFDEKKQDQLMAASMDSSVKICSLAMAALNRTPYMEDAEAEQWVLDGIGVLKRMNLRIALLPFFNKGDLIGQEAGIQEVIRRLRRLAPLAEEAGVVFGIESWLKVLELERILDAVNSTAVQVYYDIGNMQKVGEDVGLAIRHLGRERICEIHLKDYDGLYGKGTMNFPAVRSALDAINYRGWIGIEGKPLPLGIEKSIRYNVEYLRPLFPPTLK